jgi:hypothetical protein
MSKPEPMKNQKRERVNHKRDGDKRNKPKRGKSREY